MSGKPKKQGQIARTVACNLAQLKSATKMSWSELSNRVYVAGVDIPPLALTRMCEDKRGISIDEAAAIANVFGLGLSDIVLPGVVDQCREHLVRWTLENLR